MANYRSRSIAIKIKKQEGVAILTAMLILMITSVLATKIMWNAQIYQRQAESTVNSEQIMMMLQSAEAWAGNILYMERCPSVS